MIGNLVKNYMLYILEQIDVLEKNVWLPHSFAVLLDIFYS